MNKDKLPELLTPYQAAEFLNVSSLTLKRWEKRGLINPVRVGPRRDRRYYKQEVLDIYNGKQK